jgi:tRNA(adenine34) deaminase
MDHITYMNMALELAREAAAEGEVPVGCVIVCKDQVVGKGRNHRETGKNALGHAEIQAIDEACKTLGGWRLWECTLYVTLEPCAMCAGAILNARIPRVVYGARDQKYGAVDSVCSLFSMDFNHRPQVQFGLLEEKSQALMTAFFRELREKNKDKPKWKKAE